MSIKNDPLRAVMNKSHWLKMVTAINNAAGPDVELAKQRALGYVLALADLNAITRDERDGIQDLIESTAKQAAAQN